MCLLIVRGGLESHPQLITGTRYKASDNVTTMKRGRDIALSMALTGFLYHSVRVTITPKITVKEVLKPQAKRHRCGRGVNAAICRKRPPRTGVEELVVNLHWSTCNVNSIMDQHKESLILSNDAKAIVMADIALVKNPGHSWRLPDHSWDQSRTNAITPITFVFLESLTTNVTVERESTTMQEQDKGSLIYLLF